MAAELLEGLKCFIFVCDDAELNRRETLQSAKDFIMPRRKHDLPPHACIGAGFVSPEVVRFKGVVHS